MLAVPLAEEEVEPLLPEGLSVAAINGPTQCVVSGPAAAVEELRLELEREEIEPRTLHISTAGHSVLVEPILAEFERLVASVDLRPPAVPFVSDTTGSWLTGSEAASPAYWSRHLRWPVRFAAALSTLLSDPDRILLEVGPGRTLATLARRHPEAAGHLVTPTLPHPVDRASDLATLLTAVGRLWASGAPIDWSRVHEGERRRRVPLPTYPFEGERYLVEPPEQSEVAAPAEPVLVPEPAAPPASPETDDVDEPRTDAERAVAAVFEEILGLARIGRHDNFFELGGDSLIATQLVARMREELSAEVPLRALYEAPTVARFAPLVDELLGGARRKEAIGR
jgi:acyl transferase domain-containing protein